MPKSKHTKRYEAYERLVSNIYRLIVDCPVPTSDTWIRHIHCKIKEAHAMADKYNYDETIIPIF